MADDPTSKDRAFEDTPDATELKPSSGSYAVFSAGFVGVVGQGIVLAASLVATPILIRLLGPAGYGLLTLVNSVVAYLSFADLGMASATTRLGSRAYAQKDSNTEAALVWTGAAITGVTTALAAVILFSLGAPLVELVLRIPADLRRAAIASLYLGAIAALFRALSGTFNTPQLLRGWYSTYAFTNTCAAVLQLTLAPFAVMLLGGVVPAIGAAAVAAIVGTALHLYFAHRALPRFSRAFPRRDLVGPLVSAGGNLTLVSGVGQLLANVDRPVLAHSASLFAVAQYSVALSIASLMTTVTAALSQPLFVAFARARTVSEPDQLQRVYARVMIGTIFWCPAAAIVLAAAGEFILRVWGGPQLGYDSLAPFYLLTVGVALNTLAFPAYQALLATGHARSVAVLCLAELPFYLVGLLILSRVFGASGAALAWVLRVTLEFFLLTWLVGRLSPSRVSFLRNGRLDRAGVAAGLASISILVLTASHSAVATMGGGLVAAVAYLFVAWRSLLGPLERGEVRRMTLELLDRLRAQVG